MTDDGTLLITRRFDAPRAIVFAAWVDPVQAARWWGPTGFSTLSCAMDVRVGGLWRRVMRAPDGTEHAARGVYREILTPERLVFTYAWEDAAGRPKIETIVALTFAERGGKTELTLRQARFATNAARDDHREGWSGCLERFDAYLQRS